jgi:hypothetical protein
MTLNVPIFAETPIRPIPNMPLEQCKLFSKEANDGCSLVFAINLR